MLTSSTTRGLAPRCREQDPLSSWSCMLHTTIPRDPWCFGGVAPRHTHTKNRWTRKKTRRRRGGGRCSRAPEGLVGDGGREGAEAVHTVPQGGSVLLTSRGEGAEAVRGHASSEGEVVLRDYRELWAPSGGEGGDGHWRRWSQACIRGRCTIGRRGARGGPRGPARAGGQEAGE